MGNLSFGRVAWMKANLPSPCLRGHLLWTAKEVRR
jgi:hypothetical protein